MTSPRRLLEILTTHCDGASALTSKALDEGFGRNMGDVPYPDEARYAPTLYLLKRQILATNL